MKKRIIKKQRKAQSAPAFFTSANDIVAPKESHNTKSDSSTHLTQSSHRETVKQSVIKKSSPTKTPKVIIKKKEFKETSPQQPIRKPYKKANYAFIDGQNLNKAIQSQGWSLDYREFRKYLEEKYHVKKAYMFIGLITTNQTLYSALQDFGFHLVFKPTIANKFGDVKGNVDAEMVLYAITQMEQYNKAVIVSGDGDFYTLVQYLQSKGKLEKLLVPNEQAYSSLYDTLDIDASFVTDLRKKLEYTKRQK